MLNYEQFLAQVRTDLHEPNAHFPSDDLILQRLADVSQEMHLRASLVGGGATQKSSEIIVSTGDPFSLQAVDVGKIIRVHLSEQPSGARRFYKIPVINREDIGSYSERLTDEMPSACVVSIKDGQRQLEFLPAPLRTYYGKVWYEQGEVNRNKRDMVTNLPEYGFLLRAKVSLLCLPYCDWDYLRAEEKTIDLEKREMLYDQRKKRLQDSLAAAFSALIATNEARYDQYVSSLSQGGYESNDSFGQEYIDSYL